MDRRRFIKTSGTIVAGSAVFTAANANCIINQHTGERCINSDLKSAAPRLSGLKIVPFEVDVTPQIGAQLAYDINKGTESPIFVRGLILDDTVHRSVIVSCDFLGISGLSWLDWRKTIADAAGTSDKYVFLHSVHQHDSMRINRELDKLMRREFNIGIVDESYYTDSLSKTRAAIKSAVDGKWLEVENVMTAERRMSGLASTRRIIDTDGNFFTMRWAICESQELRDHPIGTIDPFLRTIAFTAVGGRVAVALHFYASHPMAAYRMAMVGSDVPGVAIDYAKQQLGSDTVNIYLTGAGGNVGFGKYHCGDKVKSRRRLGRRLGEGIVANLKSLEAIDFNGLDFGETDFTFSLNPKFNSDEITSRIKKGTWDDTNIGELINLVRTRKRIETWHRWEKASIYRLSIGDKLHILSMPGELSVEYQLYAQSLVPEHFLAMAAYGNYLYGYIPTAKMFEEGGYEAEVSIATPQVEQEIKNATYKLLDKFIGKTISSRTPEISKIIYELPLDWSFRIDPADKGVEQQWFDSGLDNWQPIRTDDFWTNQGYDYHGIAWYKTEFNIPKDKAAAVKRSGNLVLHFGAVDGTADIYLDSVKIGEQKREPAIMWDKEFVVPLPDDFAIEGKHTLAVRVRKDGYAAGIWKPVSVAVTSREKD